VIDRKRDKKKNTTEREKNQPETMAEQNW